MSFVTPWSGLLEEGTYTVSMPSNIQLPNGNIYNFKRWEDSSVNPVRTINLVSDLTLDAMFEYVAPPPAKGSIQVHAFLDGQEIVATATILELNQLFQTPKTVEVDPGTYTVQVELEGYSSFIESVTVLEGQTIRVDAQFATPLSPWKAFKEWWNRRTPQEKGVIVISGIPLSVYAISKIRRG